MLVKLSICLAVFVSRFGAVSSIMHVIFVMGEVRVTNNESIVQGQLMYWRYDADSDVCGFVLKITQLGVSKID